MKNKVLQKTGACALLLFSLVSAFSFISMTKNCFSSAMVFIVDAGLMTKFQTGTISAVFYVIYAVLQMLCGALTDKRNPERFITAGLLGAAISNIIVYFNQNYLVLLLAWSFNAVMQCAVWPAIFKIASSVICDSMRGVSLFFINISASVGGIASYVVAAAVNTKWELNFLISAIGLLLFAVFWELSVMYLKPMLRERTVIETPMSEINKKSDGVGFWKLAISGGILILFFIAIMRSAFDLGLKALAPSIINESYENVSAVIATLMSTIIIVVGILGTLFGSVLYPRFIKNEALAVLILFSLAFPFICLMLLVGKINYIFIVVFLALIVFILSTASMFTSSYIANRFNKWNLGASVAGFINGGAALGIVVANMLFTALADKWGWHFTISIWVILALVSIFFAFVFLCVWNRFLKKSRSM